MWELRGWAAHEPAYHLASASRQSALCHDQAALVAEAAAVAEMAADTRALILACLWGS